MNEKQTTVVLNGQLCPVHRDPANLNIESDRITIRCCCDFLTRKYISTIEEKLKGRNISDLLDEWETDLLMNELQA